jgi:hypothetical protein
VLDKSLICWWLYLASERSSRAAAAVIVQTLLSVKNGTKRGLLRLVGPLKGHLTVLITADSRAWLRTFWIRFAFGPFCISPRFISTARPSETSNQRSQGRNQPDNDRFRKRRRRRLRQLPLPFLPPTRPRRTQSKRPRQGYRPRQQLPTSIA